MQHEHKYAQTEASIYVFVNGLCIPACIVLLSATVVTRSGQAICAEDVSHHYIILIITPFGAFI